MSFCNVTGPYKPILSEYLSYSSIHGIGKVASVAVQLQGCL